MSNTLFKIFRLLLCLGGTFVALLLCGYPHLVEKVNPDPIPAMFAFTLIFFAVAAWLSLEAYLSLRRENEELWQRIDELEAAQKKANFEIGE